MEDKECKEIIEEIKDPHNLNERCRLHVKGCKKCAAALSVLLAVKAGPTPTSGLIPSSSFVAGVLSGIGLKTAASATTATSVTTSTAATGTVVTSKVIIGAIIAVTLATMLSFGIMLKSDGGVAGLNQKTKSQLTKKNIIETEIQKLSASQDREAPVLRFAAPSAPP
jgi:hypothetical protein